MWARAWARSAAGAATLQRGIMGKIIPLHESGRRSNAMGTQKQMQRAAQADEMLDKCKIPHVSMDVFTLQEVAHAPTPQPALKGYAAKDGYAADGVSGVAVGIPSCDSSVSGGGMDASGTNKRAMYMDPNVIDPFKLMEPQLRALSESIKLLVQSDNPVLHKVSEYLFEKPGKRFRPAIVLLVAQASPPANDVSQKQRRLAEITEMIHTASLMHDDVMDHAAHRRGVPSLNSVHGNQLAILAGDFLLSRASLNLARLQHVEVIELLSTVIAHLVEGEIMQSRTGGSEALNFDYYMRKTYLKTASLLAHSCKAAVLLADADDVERRRAAELSFDYGKNLGLAFQIQDDILDLVGDLETLGKEPGSDLREGITTAPVLFALEQRPELREMIELILSRALEQRAFCEDGDAEKALRIVLESDGVERSKKLAEQHSAMAIAAAEQLQPSVARDALVRLAGLVVERKA